jgi:hypothetical protein
MRAAARLVSTRSRWSLNIVKNFTIFQVSNTAMVRDFKVIRSRIIDS